MTSIMQLSAIIAVFILSASFAVNAESMPFIYKLNRFKRQFGANVDPSLQQSLQNLQNTQQQQQQNLRPWQQGQNQNGGQLGQQGGQFGQQGSQFGQQGGQFGQQGGQWNQNQGGFGGQGGQNFQLASTTQRTPANIISNQNTVDEAACIRNCQATNQWNPVCGTDNISYANLNKLRCAQQCGRQVSFVYNGSCVTTPAP